MLDLIAAATTQPVPSQWATDLKTVFDAFGNLLGPLGTFLGASGLIAAYFAYRKSNSAEHKAGCAEQSATQAVTKVETATQLQQNSINNVAATARQALANSPPASGQQVVIPLSAVSPPPPTS